MRYSSTSGGAGIGADGDGDFHALAANSGGDGLRDGVGADGGGGSTGGKGHDLDLARGIFGGGAHVIAGMFGGDLLALPVHSGGLAVVDLHAVHADVALAAAGIACDDARQSDEAAAVLRPGLQNREFEDIDVLATQDDLFAGSFPGVDGFREEAADLGEHGEQLQLVHDSGGGDGMEQRLDALGDVVERVHF
jgi:hypothetical protein